MKAIILEDNISNAWDYEMVLNEHDVQVIGVYKTWKEAIPFFKKDLPDLMIIDLMLDKNEKGTDFLKQIKKYFIPTIICTGYPKAEYLDLALEEGVKAFLTKPVDKASLTFHVRKLIQEINLQKEYLLVKDKGCFIKVPYKEIYKIEIERNYSYIHISKKKKYIIKLSLTKLESKLKKNKFKRCHRSTIVNLDFISSINVITNKILLTNNESIDLGNKFKSTIKEAFLNIGS